MCALYLESQVKTKPTSELISSFVFIVILSYSLWSYRCTDLKGANLQSEFYDSIVPESAKSTSLKPTYKDGMLIE